MFTFTQQYDANSRRTQLAATIGDDDDFVTDYLYDNLARVDTIKQHGVTSGNAVAEKYVDFAYDAASQWDTIARYADLEGEDLVAATDYLFDLAGRLTGITHAKDSTIFGDYDFGFDAAGRMTSMEFDWLNESDLTSTYTNDATGQLTDATHDYQDNEDYDYDQNGNRTNNGYTVGDNNQLTKDGTYRYLYDHEGNREFRFIDNDEDGEISDGDEDISKYVWDRRNRLIEVQHFDDYAAYDGDEPDQVVEYAYDFGNRWVRRILNPATENEQRTIFVHDGNQIGLQFDADTDEALTASDLSHRYLWGPATDQILADENVTSLLTPGRVYWPLPDHLNTVRDIVILDSGTTTLVKHLEYNSYGLVTLDTAPTLVFLHLFTARPFDPTSGLQNNLNRWYDAMVGRWASQDPVAFLAGNNPQVYVLNNPLKHRDSMGLSPIFGNLSAVPDIQDRFFAVITKIADPGEDTGLTLLLFRILEFLGYRHPDIYSQNIGLLRSGLWGPPKPSVSGQTGEALYPWPKPDSVPKPGQPQIDAVIELTRSWSPNRKLLWGSGTGRSCNCARWDEISSCVVNKEPTGPQWDALGLTGGSLVNNCNTDIDDTVKGCCLSGYQAPPWSHLPGRDFLNAHPDAALQIFYSVIWLWLLLHPPG